MKPSVFVGSSSEGLALATIVAAHLETDFAPALWTQGLFVPGAHALEALEDAVRQCMFAVIVGSEDDELTKRNITAATLRDNLVFEFGLFLGALGRKRTILMVPDGTSLTLPTDLDGLVVARYTVQNGPPTSREWLHSLQLATGEVTNALRRELAQHERNEAHRRTELLQDRRREAIRRLHRAVTQLRDLFIELPTAMLGSLGDHETFNEVKSNAIQRVKQMHEGWAGDAEFLGVVRQLDALVNATCGAIRDLPYPAVHVHPDEATDITARLLERGTEADSVASAVSGVADQVGREAARKADEFAQMYRDWWQTHSVALRRKAYDLQDALMAATLS